MGELFEMPEKLKGYLDMVISSVGYDMKLVFPSRHAIDHFFLNSPRQVKPTRVVICEMWLYFPDENWLGDILSSFSYSVIYAYLKGRAFGDNDTHYIVDPSFML